MIGLTEIKKVQGQGTFAKHEIGNANNLILDVIQFACCNKFMRLLRILFRKKFDERYDKLLKAQDRLRLAEEFLDDQWDLLEDYWNKEANSEW